MMSDTHSIRARSDVIESHLRRHARAETPRRVTRRGPRLRGDPRLSRRASAGKTWMAGTSPIGANMRCPRAFCSLAPLLPSGRLRPSATGYGEGRGEGRRLSTRSDSRRGPLTRNLREERANSDLSPQAGRGEAARQQLNLALMATSPAMSPEKRFNMTGIHSSRTSKP
jgi:hypothetical protein